MPPRTPPRLRALALPLLLVACEREAASSYEGSPVVPSAVASDAPPERSPTPVLVELFTSQGCSSCPPADALLRELVAEPPRGVVVVPLAFHVDYWDGLGWPDPFADPRWTERQTLYSAARGTTRIYTPQLLLGGEDHRVGTRRGRADAALRAASAQAPAVDLALEVTRDHGELHVAVDPRWREQAERAPLAIMVAVTDGDHHTAVPLGENAGATLESDFVVRDLARACLLPPDAPVECRATLSLAEVDRPDTLHVVAFAQETGSGRVRGAAIR